MQTTPARRPSALAAAASRGSTITLGSQGLKFVGYLAFTVVLARLLSPSDYGLIAMVVAISAVADVLRDFGLGTAAMTTRDLSQQQQSNLLWINTALGAVVAGAAYLAAPLIAHLYGDDRLIPIAHVIAVIYLFNGFSVQFRMVINRAFRFTALAVSDVVPYLASFSLAVALALTGLGYWSLVVQQVAYAGLSMLLTVVLARWRPSLPRRAPMRALLGTGTNLALTQLIAYATRNVDSIVIGRFYGPAVLGQYDRAYQLLMLPLNQLNTPLSKVALPVLRAAADDLDRLQRILVRAQLVAIYLTATLFLTVAGAAPTLVPLLLGQKWRFAGIVLSALAIGGLFRALSQVSFWGYISTGNSAAQLRFYAIGQPAVIACMLIGLLGGPIGVAIGHSAGFAMYWLASLVAMGRATGLAWRPLFDQAVRVVLTIGAPGFLGFFLAGFLPVPDLLKLVLPAVLVCGYWAAVVWRVPAVRRDLGTIRTFAASGRRA